MPDPSAIRAYAAATPKATLLLQTMHLPQLAAYDVEVEVECCSLCHSDLHLLDGDWAAPFPLVPGHEIVGRVRAIGARVSKLKLNQRVGIGWQCGACGTCRMCISGQQQLCLGGKRRTCVGHSGGLGEWVQAHEDFCFSIPDALSSAEAAPLMCAGITVFAPLKRHIMADGMRVGIIGLGGLGHLAVQFARALGAVVTVFDPVASKAAEAEKLGATQFVTVDESFVATCQHLQSQFDFILSTTHAALDWNKWLSLLDLNGCLCLVGVPPGSLQIDAEHLLDGQKKLTGSVIGSPEDMRAMLVFAAQYAIRPWIQLWPMQQANQALASLRRGEARYRIVLAHEL